MSAPSTPPQDAPFTDEACGFCGGRLVGVEYCWTVPEHYDGVSEWCCADCGVRVGRWSGRTLNTGELEPRHGVL